jgi:hypothetical protein
MIALLLAIEKTPLYERLQGEGRLVPERIASDNLKLATNVIPKRMTYDEMITGYRDLYYRLLRYPALAERIRNKNRFLSHPAVGGNGRRLGENISGLGKLIRHVLRDGGVSGLFHVLRSLPLSKPRLIPRVFQDWAYGLSTRDYIERHFTREAEGDRRRTATHLAQMKKALQHYIHLGNLNVSLSGGGDSASRLTFRINGRLDRAFFRRASHRLEKMLRHTKSSLILQIEEFDTRELHLFRDMMRRLRRYHGRIRIVADESSRRIIGIDSSVFDLALVPVPTPRPIGRAPRR